MIDDNPNVCLGIVDYSLSSSRIVVKQAYHQKKWASTPVETTYLEVLA